MPVSAREEDEDLQQELEMRVENSLRDANFYREQRPLVLVVETGDEGDDQELQGESDCSQEGEGEEEEKQHSLSLPKVWVSPSQSSANPVENWE